MTVSHRHRTTSTCHYGPGRFVLGARPTDPKCSICSGDHEVMNHRCPVEGCKVGKGRPCPHGWLSVPTVGGLMEHGRMPARPRGRPGGKPGGGDRHLRSVRRNARGPRSLRSKPRPPKGKRRVRWRLVCRRRKGPSRRPWRWRWRSRGRSALFSPFLFFSYLADFSSFPCVRRLMGRRRFGTPHYNRASWFEVGKGFFRKARRCHGPPGRM